MKVLLLSSIKLDRVVSCLLQGCEVFAYNVLGNLRSDLQTKIHNIRKSETNLQHFIVLLQTFIYKTLVT